MRAHNLSLPGLDGDRDLSKSQWYTPQDLAGRMWRWWRDNQTRARPDKRWHVLEPSAGNGSLVRPLLVSGDVAKILAIELDPRNVETLHALNLVQGPTELQVEHDDFLNAPVIGRFDVAIMNPPYENGQDVDHILRALAWAPVAVGVFRSAMVHGAERYKRLWRYVDVTRGRWLSDRPAFGVGDGARSDFVVLELVMRQRPREPDEAMNLLMGWW